MHSLGLGTEQVVSINLPMSVYIPQARNDSNHVTREQKIYHIECRFPLQSDSEVVKMAGKRS